MAIEGLARALARKSDPDKLDSSSGNSDNSSDLATLE
jgi:hypothetical protein